MSVSPWSAHVGADVGACDGWYVKEGDGVGAPDGANVGAVGTGLGQGLGAAKGESDGVELGDEEGGPAIVAVMVCHFRRGGREVCHYINNR